MPEGHTIHRLAQDQTPVLVGMPVRVRSPQGRFRKEATQLDGRTLTEIQPRGKHLLYRFDDGPTWHVHLGLYGRYRPFNGAEPEPRGQVRAAVASDTGGFHLVGPNTCELLDDDGVTTLLDRLGPDPLVPGTRATKMVERVCSSRAAIGGLLLDQSVVAGVGNIYRADALFLEGIHPETRGQDLSPDEVRALWKRLRDLLKIGLKYNRIITAEPSMVGKPRSRMNRDERLLIYKADRCPVCNGPVETLQIAARRIDACPTCQPRR